MFIHGDPQVDLVFVDGDEVIGIIDWSEGSQGDALLDLATLTLRRTACDECAILPGMDELGHAQARCAARGGAR